MQLCSESSKLPTMGVAGSAAAAVPGDPAAGVSPERAVKDRFGVTRKLDCSSTTLRGASNQLRDAVEHVADICRQHHPTSMLCAHWQGSRQPRRSSVSHSWKVHLNAARNRRRT